jgi:hypothetical protein
LEEDSKKKKYRLTKWSVVCQPKDQGGHGIHVLKVKNRASLGKWLFKGLIGSMPLQLSHIGEMPLQKSNLKKYHYNFFIPLMMPF